MSATSKNWWAPVWRGLVIDASGQHFRRMGIALWLYNYLLLRANRQTGRLPWKLATAVLATGIPRRTLERYLGRLCREGYVTRETVAKTTWLAITRWKPLGRAPQLTRPSATSGGLLRHKWRSAGDQNRGIREQ